MRWFTCLLVSGVLAGPLAADPATAESLFARQRYAEAQAKFEQRVAEQPEDALAHYYLGRLARLRQDLPKAIEHLETAAALAPEDAATQYEYGAVCGLHADTLGMSFRAASFARKGRAALERAVSLAPEELRYRQGLLEFYRTAPGIVGGSMTKAYEQAEAIRQLQPRDGALAVIGLLVHEQRYAESLVEAQQLLADHPDHPMVLYRFGEAVVHTGQHTERGIEALQRCLELPEVERGPVLSRVHWRLGQLRERHQDIRGARLAYRTALQLEPTLQPAAVDLARLPREPSP
jgi:tetratricopeptide (TPR) repeat protein